uniref:lysoplasmalogenase n=2 Tax=Megaselia scalaris TaxID=36166 RepID=T1GJ13_MEGSC
MLFILMHKLQKNCYLQKILLGLIFSVCGDALLNIDLFPHGMGAFALAQICYISAYGLKPLKPLFAIPFYALAVALYVLVLKNLDPILTIGLPVYAFLLTTMVWRSMVQAHTTPDGLNKLCAFGSFMFAISDGFIAVDKFYVEIPHARVSILGGFCLKLELFNERMGGGLAIFPKRIHPAQANEKSKRFWKRKAVFYRGMCFIY